MKGFEFQLLGPLEVRGEDGPVQLGGPKQRALLELLITKPPGYLLRIDPDQLDVNRAQALLAGARDAPPAERAAKLREAIELWRGPPLEEFGFEAFAQGEIARLAELRLTLLEERIEADLEAGRAGEVVGELEALVGEHPLRERVRAAPAQDHFDDVVRTMLAGRVVPVLGTDVAELTAQLAQRFG